MTADLSLGLAGALGPDLIARLAAEAERAGFATLWINDTPDGDAIAALAAAARTTTRIRLATGVVPLDRRPAPELAAQARAAGLPPERLTLGVGSGAARHDQLALVRDGVGRLRESLPEATLVVGALGPRMRRLAATTADGVLLTWLTPEAAAQQRADADGARAVLYVRTALDEDAQSRLDDEADRYSGYPAYAAHFARLGFGARDTVITPATPASTLAAYRAAVDEVVLRAIVSVDDEAHYTRFIAAAAEEVTV